MTAPQSRPAEYTLSCSDRTRHDLLRLSRESRARGDGDEFLVALREFEYRLRVYPQFGDPLMDLAHIQGVVRVGLIGPLSMRYVVAEEDRLVLLSALPILMPRRSR